MPRRSTRGPLDLSEAPVSEAASPTSSQILSPPLLPSAQRGISPGPALTTASNATKDFSKLLRPEIYHPLTQLETPPSFRSSTKQPSPETSLDVLLSTGHFRAAAISAANKLTLSTSPSDTTTIFDLLYIRLVCLTLCESTALAAQEVKSLEDLNSTTYRDELTDKHFVPWELRVLAVRLQGMGFNDPRRGVMGYYDLAREARGEIMRIKSTQNLDDVELKTWEARLEDLGVRVASALVEMDDLLGAAHHLSTLKTSTNHQVALAKALLWLKLGNVAAAKQCVDVNLENVALIGALSSMADGEYETASLEWKTLCDKEPSNAMYAQNMAVCLLYSGRLDEARQCLEGLVESGNGFHGLTFNLSTIYELCTDRSCALKVRLSEKVAALPDTDGRGWEKSNVDFKL